MCVIASTTSTVIDWAAYGNWWLAVLMAVLGLGFIIFVHELGHFAVAKWCGVKCDKFYLGFDVPFGRFFNWILRREGEFSLFGLKVPKTIGRPVKWGDTEYGIGILPLGGYVRMLGQNDDPRMTEEQIRESEVVDENIPTTEVVGPDGEMHKVDSRSYIAKTVPQRMAIISAGVVMNVIFAFIFAVIAFRIGVPSMPSIVSATDPGTPAWKVGLRPDDEIVRIGDIENPWFEQLTNEIVLSGRGEAVEVEIRGRDEPLLLKPSRERRKIAQIGVAPPVSLELAKKNPANSFTPAAEVADRIPAGATIVAVNGIEVKTYGQLTTELVANRDQAIEYTFLKKGEKTKVRVPANPREYVGLVMSLGPITAIQAGSPAEEAGLAEGDLVTAIDSKPIGMQSDGQLAWNPRTLGDELAALGDRGEAVVLQVVRRGQEQGAQPEDISVTLRPVTWIESSMSKKSPLSVPALGATFSVPNKIAAITQGSPAESQDIEAGDVIESATLVVPKEHKKQYEKMFAGLDDPIEFSQETQAWPLVMELIQDTPPGTKLKLNLLRTGVKEAVTVELPIAEAEGSYDAKRGITLQRIFRDRYGDTFGDQCSLAWSETKRSLTSVYRFLNRLINNDIPATALGGPITIARASFFSALDGPGRLLIFMTLISANLAVVNFLPIPVLDGGHMLFLTYQGIFRRPAHPLVFELMTLAGFAFIVGLMLFVFGLDLGLIDRNL
ncbi:MAG: site-2 protease family protein [Aeoliella sp.]